MADNEVKLFGKWSFEDVTCSDLALVDYIAVKPVFAIYQPHSAGRYNRRRFQKATCPIVERLTNSLMVRLGHWRRIGRAAVHGGPEGGGPPREIWRRSLGGGRKRAEEDGGGPR